jgi:mRNA interferase RelE/StbE
MKYSLFFTEHAVKFLSRLPKEHIIRIRDTLDDLAGSGNPFHSIKRLKALDPPLFSLRVGEYRAILAIEQDRLVIIVIDIGHRSTVYRKF